MVLMALKPVPAGHGSSGFGPGSGSESGQEGQVQRDHVISRTVGVQQAS